MKEWFDNKNEKYRYREKDKASTKEGNYSR